VTNPDPGAHYHSLSAGKRAGSDQLDFALKQIEKSRNPKLLKLAVCANMMRPEEEVLLKMQKRCAYRVSKSGRDRCEIPRSRTALCTTRASAQKSVCLMARRVQYPEPDGTSHTRLSLRQPEEKAAETSVRNRHQIDITEPKFTCLDTWLLPKSN
jgi:hypothetical protein